MCSTRAMEPTNIPHRLARCLYDPAASSPVGPDLVSFDGQTVAIVGDITHSRVARSNVLLLTTLGRR